MRDACSVPPAVRLQQNTHTHTHTAAPRVTPAASPRLYVDVDTWVLTAVTYRGTQRSLAAAAVLHCALGIPDPDSFLSRGNMQSAPCNPRTRAPARVTRPSAEGIQGQGRGGRAGWKSRGVEEQGESLWRGDVGVQATGCASESTILRRPVDLGGWSQGGPVKRCSSGSECKGIQEIWPG